MPTFIIAERSKDPEKLGEMINQIPSEYQNEEVYISVITASELLMGVHRASDPEIRSVGNCLLMVRWISLGPSQLASESQGSIAGLA